MLDVKFGACEWALPGNGVGSIRLAKEIGLSGLQLGFVSYERGFMLSQQWFRDRYREEAAKYGIELPSLAVCEFDAYGLRNPPATEKGKIAREIVELAVEAAADMRMSMVMAPSFVTVSSSPTKTWNTPRAPWRTRATSPPRTAS